MAKYRPHRGLLDEGMKRVFEFETTEELLVHLRKEFEGFIKPENLTEETIEVDFYGNDTRNNWNTYIVHLPNFGVLGFIDGPLK